MWSPYRFLPQGRRLTEGPITAGMPRLPFGSRPLGKRLAALPAARETLGDAALTAGYEGLFQRGRRLTDRSLLATLYP